MSDDPIPPPWWRRRLGGGIVGAIDSAMLYMGPLGIVLWPFRWIMDHAERRYGTVGVFLAYAILFYGVVGFLLWLDQRGR